MATLRIVGTTSSYTASVDGASLTRTYLLEGVAGAGDDGYLINAGLDAGVPAVNDIHPSLSALRVHTKTARDLGNGMAEVQVEYRPGGLTSVRRTRNPPSSNNEGIVWNTSYSLEARKVTKDKNGADIQVTRPTALQDADGEPTQILEVERLTPVGIIRGERRELRPPMARLRTAMGHVNSSSHGSYAARTLLCTGIGAQTENTSPDPGVSYDGWFVVVYEFAYQPLTWATEGTWTKFSGEQPPAHDSGSRKNFDVYPEVNFESALNLSFSDPS